ncbi:hypothetical protein Goklo_013567 [Gossypium klotzschianum]|uniref:Uncharacterized protein n=1 Tax=Gossypium klotzschianum TaxID=34286 RepID=A0A7J8U4R3_9ROSI|nr:hypothetical protein [Gossypium klotzschianum]
MSTEPTSIEGMLHLLLR